LEFRRVLFRSAGRHDPLTQLHPHPVFLGQSEGGGVFAFPGTVRVEALEAAEGLMAQATVAPVPPRPRLIASSAHACLTSRSITARFLCPVYPRAKTRLKSALFGFRVPAVSCLRGIPGAAHRGRAPLRCRFLIALQIVDSFLEKFRVILELAETRIA